VRQGLGGGDGSPLIGHPLDATPRYASRPTLDVVIKTLVGGAIGLVAGLWSAESVLRVTSGLDATTIGAWTAAVDAGTSDADPYTRAAIERSGEVPLALGEGLQLIARVDDSGAALDPRCVYRVGSKAPAARYWTLGVVDRRGFPIANPAERSIFRSSELLRDENGGFVITFSASARPGNWLPVGAPHGFYLALRLYDTPFSATATAIDKNALPRIVRESCR
jgi:hypothetical protein